MSDKTYRLVLTDQDGTMIDSLEDLDLESIRAEAADPRSIISAMVIPCPRCSHPLSQHRGWQNGGRCYLCGIAAERGESAPCA